MFQTTYKGCSSALFFAELEKNLMRQVASEKYSAAVLLSTFFACAKKVTKKAQPILMRNVSSVEYLRAKIGVLATELIEHFRLNVTTELREHFQLIIMQGDVIASAEHS